jgi:hypothetical protein
MNQPTTRAEASMPAFGDRVRMPQVASIFPVECHPDNDPTEERLFKVIDRPYLMRYWGSADAVEAYARQRIPTFGGLCYPHTKPELFFALARQMNVTTLMDEAFARPDIRASAEKSLQLRDQYLAAVDGVKPSPDFPLADLFYDALPCLLANMRPRVASRYLDCVRTTAQVIGDRPAYQIDDLSFAEYLEIRRIDVFGEWAMTLVEFALGLDMTDHLKNIPALARARQCAIDSTTLANDLFSFYKEVRARDPFNGVWILQCELNGDLGAALQRLANIFQENEMALLIAQEEVLAGSQSASPDIRQFLRELQHFSSGDLEFHRFSARYQGDGAGWWDGSEAREITIQPIIGPHEIAAKFGASHEARRNDEVP